MNNTVERDDTARRAKERLVASRPAREQAAAAHALTMNSIPYAGADAPSEPSNSTTSIETRLLDVARDILRTKGEKGQTLALMIDRFVHADHAGERNRPIDEDGSPPGDRG